MNHDQPQSRDQGRGRSEDRFEGESQDRNRRILLAARPDGAPKDGDFRLEEAPIPSPGDGELLLRTIYLSLDPYMRSRMNEGGAGYAPGVELGGVMPAGGVSEIVESRVEGFRPGDIVSSFTGWQSYSVARAGRSTRTIDPAAAPISTAVGVLGMPGMTAYMGLLRIGQPKDGETVVVSAASGAVGAVVGQIARIKGCRVVGIAGAKEKCDYVVDELGFDACVSHRDPDLAGKLGDACPDGIDVYFENVGGPVFQAVLPLLNPFARVPLCGLIAQYSAKPGDPPAGPAAITDLMRAALTRRLLVRGFIVYDFADREEEFHADMSAWVRSGEVRYREDVVEGIENAPRAFQGLLQGRNFGKLLVRVAPDPTHHP